MSIEKFDDNCPGCRPAILDLKTGKVLPDDNPVMAKMLGIWATTTLAQRQAYHRVMCLNSRETVDLLLVRALMDRFKGAAEDKN